MLRPQAQYSLRNAREYFREHLCVGDYYMEGQKIDGEWFGQGAGVLGLSGKVDEKAFLALCDGNDPRTGRLLTLRLNSVRHENGRETANRRIFYDFTIGPPKSVSIAALYQDERIVDLHNRAVRLAMTELEKFAETRVRKGGQNGERVTGNVVGACFRHDTSRELDPHLHTHCVVMNATFDPKESRWKALQTHGMYRAQKFIENYYFHELCKGLRTLGYGIENNARNFELRHVPATAIARFSKRRRQIVEETGRRIARDGFRGSIDVIREQVAHDHRRRKTKGATADRLRPLWASQMQPDERAALARLPQSAPPLRDCADVPSIVAWADQHLFERRSVVEDHELMSAALARGRGDPFDLADLTRAIEASGYVREVGTRKLTLGETGIQTQNLDALRLATRLLAADVVALPGDCLSVREKWREIHGVRREGVIDAFAPATVAVLRREIAPLMQWREVRGSEASLDFDVLIARLQSARLAKASTADDLLDTFVIQISQLPINLRQVAEKLSVIQRAKSSEFARTATTGDLEEVRIALRGIMQFRQRPKVTRDDPIFLNVAEDQAEYRTEIHAPKLEGLQLAAYRNRVESVLRELLEKSDALQKIHAGQPVPSADLDALVSEVLVMDPDLNLEDLLVHYPNKSRSLALAIRQVIGLDAAKVDQHFRVFVQKYPSLNANQIRFLELLKSYIARYGVIEASTLWESPFTTLHVEGVDGVFTDSGQIDDLLGLLTELNQIAA